MFCSSAVPAHLPALWLPTSARLLAARGLSITVNARSESTVEDYVDEIDCLMIGPHLASTLPEMEEICEGYDVKVGVIEQAAYARLNGDAALDQILGMFGEA